MRNLRIAFTATLVMLLAAAAVPAAMGVGDILAQDDAADPELGPLICGTSSYVEGTFVWTDYAYDDHGADAEYPEWAAPGNAADLIQLQIGVQSDGLHLLAILETLVDPDIPILGVAFDTDADLETGAASLPGDSWPADGPLGVEYLVVVTSAGAELWSYTGEAWPTIADETFDATVDPDSNVMETVVPSNLLVTPEEGIWRAFGVLGIRNAAGGSWLDGSEVIYDLAFVGDEIPENWQDQRQSAILAGTLDSSNAAAEIDFAEVSASTTELAEGDTPGFHTYLYHSRLDLGEGISDDLYLGPYLPYLVRIPEDLPNEISVTVKNVGTVAFDLEQAGISAGEDSTINIVTDSVVEVTLKGLSPNWSVMLGATLLATVDSQGRATFDLSAGEHTLTVAEPTFVLSDLTISPGEIRSWTKDEHDFTVSVEVTNTSIVPGTYDVVVQVQGVGPWYEGLIDWYFAPSSLVKVRRSDVQRADVFVEAGASETVSLTVTQEQPAVYRVAVCPIEASGLVVFPREPEKGEAVTISVDVTNTGIGAWTDKVVLKLDGTEIDSQVVTLKEGASESVIFELIQEKSGEYTIEVGELDGEFIIKTSGPTINPVLGGLLLVLVIGGVVILVRRNRAAA